MPNLSKMDGNWILTGDFVLDGQVTPTQVVELKLISVTNDHFTGTYVSPPNDKSQFDGHIYASSRGTAITIVQSNPGANYYAAFAAWANGEVIIGAWYDLQGRHGDFKLDRKNA